MDNYRKNTKAIILFLLPAFLIYTFIEVVPVMQSIYFSFFEWPGIKGVPLEFVGMNNFIHVLGNSEFWHSMRNVLWFLILSLLTQLPVGLVLAILLSTYCKGYKVFKTIFFIPLILSVTAVSLMWYFILFPNNGALNTFLTSIGLEKLTRAWLIDKNTALNTVILVSSWIGCVYYMTINFAAISAIPEEIIDAALLDGAVGIKKILYITLPLIWESIKISVVLIITGVLKVFDVVFILTGGGPNGLTNVPTTLMYDEAFKYSHYGYGSAISTIIFVVSLIFTLASLKLMNGKKSEY